ncbi:hypothetical protein HPB47_011786 [Ixodes persulcatus]|uniref:Uncharacterized protein n=1 Tax=Ixodes persulcatus TaxID=34615 RepID=A0AC60NVG9_IXOPE|nr:hypothetical protein HPB47_011786 [Ixodes persulcatus]
MTTHWRGDAIGSPFSPLGLSASAPPRSAEGAGADDAQGVLWRPKGKRVGRSFREDAEATPGRMIQVKATGSSRTARPGRRPPQLGPPDTRIGRRPWRAGQDDAPGTPPEPPELLPRRYTLFTPVYALTEGARVQLTPRFGRPR